MKGHHDEKVIFMSEQETPDQKASSEALSALTTPSRPSAATVRRVIDAVAKTPPPEPTALSIEKTPWVLQQFFNGEIDLDVELAQRFQNMPVMATINFRSMGTKSKRGVASLATQDNAAQMIIDVDAVSKVAQFSFSFGSMLTLRFTLDELSDVDRVRWLELMRRKEGGLTFLWGPSRWEHDYLICSVRRYYTNLYAFSPHNFEAVARLTPEVTRQLLDWLETFWKAEPPKADAPPLLTW
jgi:hypothetical protein